MPPGFFKFFFCVSGSWTLGTEFLLDCMSSWVKLLFSLVHFLLCGRLLLTHNLHVGIQTKNLLWKPWPREPCLGDLSSSGLEAVQAGCWPWHSGHSGPLGPRNGQNPSYGHWHVGSMIFSSTWMEMNGNEVFIGIHRYSMFKIVQDKPLWIKFLRLGP